MRDVLVRVRDLSHWGDICAYAADIAARTNGTLTGVYVEPVPLPIAVPGAGADVVVAARQSTRVDMDHAARDFVTWATQVGARQAFWQVAEGDAPNVLARLSASHDLLVVGRDPYEPLASVAELGEIVVASRAPVILAPSRRRDAMLDCIAVAWNHSQEALAAIHAARPLLAHAGRLGAGGGALLAAVVLVATVVAAVVTALVATVVGGLLVVPAGVLEQAEVLTDPAHRAAHVVAFR